MSPSLPPGRSRGFAATRGRITILPGGGENKVMGRGVGRAKGEGDGKRERIDWQRCKFIVARGKRRTRTGNREANKRLEWEGDQSLRWLIHPTFPYVHAKWIRCASWLAWKHDTFFLDVRIRSRDCVGQRGEHKGSELPTHRSEVYVRTEERRYSCEMWLYRNAGYVAMSFRGRTHARHSQGVKLISQWRLESLTCYLGNPGRPKPLAVAFPHFPSARSIGRTTNYTHRHTPSWNIVIFLTLREQDYRLSLFHSTHTTIPSNTELYMLDMPP